MEQWRVASTRPWNFLYHLEYTRGILIYAWSHVESQNTRYSFSSLMNRMEEKGWLGTVSRRGRSWRPSILYDLASSINPLPSSFAFSILHREASSYTTYPLPLLVLFSFDSCIAPTLSRPSSNPPPAPRCRVIEFLGIFLCDVEAHEVGSIN